MGYHTRYINITQDIVFKPKLLTTKLSTLSSEKFQIVPNQKCLWRVTSGVCLQPPCLNVGSQREIDCSKLLMESYDYNKVQGRNRTRTGIVGSCEVVGLFKKSRYTRG